MATLVFFHAHPDDESINTSGTMARAAAEGHRVVLAIATAGEEGEVAEGFLAEGEPLGDRRRAETEVSAAALGVARTVFLGYRDSGMMGTEANDHPGSFWMAPVGEAAGRLAALLQEESADILVAYDSNGGYGHPDHIQVHRVGHAAAVLAGTPRVFEATTNRDRVKEQIAKAREAGVEEFEDEDESFYDTLGSPDAEITTEVDVTAYLSEKEASLRAHASQIPEDSWFLSMSPPDFNAAFGIESFIRTRPPFEGRIPEDREDWLL
jgi:LmbE family N-acetylglucosaminyl deacetylase